eukprot:scaffold347_cov239-Pinguiococcus_pyrenoidosus.AAC.22
MLPYLPVCFLAAHKLTELKLVQLLPLDDGPGAHRFHQRRDQTERLHRSAHETVQKVKRRVLAAPRLLLPRLFGTEVGGAVHQQHLRQERARIRAGVRAFRRRLGLHPHEIAQARQRPQNHLKLVEVAKQSHVVLAQSGAFRKDDGLEPERPQNPRGKQHQALVLVAVAELRREDGVRRRGLVPRCAGSSRCRDAHPRGRGLPSGAERRADARIPAQLLGNEHGPLAHPLNGRIQTWPRARGGRECQGAVVLGRERDRRGGRGFDEVGGKAAGDAEAHGAALLLSEELEERSYAAHVVTAHEVVQVVDRSTLEEAVDADVAQAEEGAPRQPQLHGHLVHRDHFLLIRGADARPAVPIRVRQRKRRRWRRGTSNRPSETQPWTGAGRKRAAARARARRGIEKGGQLRESGRARRHRQRHQMRSADVGPDLLTGSDALGRLLKRRVRTAARDRPVAEARGDLPLGAEVRLAHADGISLIRATFGCDEAAMAVVRGMHRARGRLWTVPRRIALHGFSPCRSDLHGRRRAHVHNGQRGWSLRA